MKAQLVGIIFYFCFLFACQEKKIGDKEQKKLSQDSIITSIDTTKIDDNQEIIAEENNDVEKHPKKFNCIGNEPFWHLEITENGMRFEELDSQKQNFPYKAPKIDGNVLIFESKNEEMAIRVKLKKEKCSDSMSDSEYSYSVNVVLDKDKVYKGCANGSKKKKKEEVQ